MVVATAANHSPSKEATVELPHCQQCDHVLDRLDRYCIEHSIYDKDLNLYRGLSVLETDLDGGCGLASEVDIRCAYCGESLSGETKGFFYKNWSDTTA